MLLHSAAPCTLDFLCIRQCPPTAGIVDACLRNLHHRRLMRTIYPPLSLHPVDDTHVNVTLEHASAVGDAQCWHAHLLWYTRVWTRQCAEARIDRWRVVHV